MNSYKELYINALTVSSLIDSLNVARWLLKISRSIVQIGENYSNKSFLQITDSPEKSPRVSQATGIKRSKSKSSCSYVTIPLVRYACKRHGSK